MHLGDSTVEAGNLAAGSATLAMPQVLQHDLEAAVREIKALRAELADRNDPNVEERLVRLEKTAQIGAEGIEAVIETVRNFEAIISIGLIERINGLIEQRLTVVSNATEKMQRARRRQWVWALLAAILAALLFAEIFDNGASTLLLATGKGMLALLSSVVIWSRRLIDA